MKLTIIKNWNSKSVDLLFVNGNVAVVDLPGLYYPVFVILPFILLIFFRGLYIEKLASIGDIIYYLLIVIVTVFIILHYLSLIKIDKFRENYPKNMNLKFFPVANIDYLKPGEFGIEINGEKILLTHKKKFISTKELEYKAVTLESVIGGVQIRENYKIKIFITVAIFLFIAVLNIIGINRQLKSEEISPELNNNISHPRDIYDTGWESL